MRVYRSSLRRATLQGWAKWLPVILIPFSVFLLETWLRTESLSNGYRKNELLRLQAEATERINALRVQEAALNRMERIDAKAPDLGLVEPDPAQIQVICAQDNSAPEPELFSLEDSYDMARLGEHSLAGAPAAASPRLTE